MIIELFFKLPSLRRSSSPTQVNEGDVFQDEGVLFYRKLLAAGVGLGRIVALHRRPSTS
jgi:hypothetical protein